MSLKILAINPGSTSTKLGLYEDKTPRHVQTLHHSNAELAEFKHVYDQLAFRREAILDFLSENGIELTDIDAFCGRGGLLRPIAGGVYTVTSTMRAHLRAAKYGEHASNLGAILADELGKKAGEKPAFIVNPVVVDELQPLARYSGMPENPRVSIFHALNQKAVAQRYAHSIDKKYETLRLIVAHMGGGITVGAHLDGCVVDVNNGLAGDGPFSPERSGGVPTLKLIELCFSGYYEPATMKRKAAGKGGLVSYLRSNDAREIESRIENGDEKAREVYQAMAYQVAKEIGAMHAVLAGNTDAIILTGGLAHSKLLTGWIGEMVGKLAEIVIYPGEDELLAMVEGTLKAIHGETPIQSY